MSVKMYIPSNGPTIFKMESNISLPIDSIVECFKESFLSVDKGKNNCPTFFSYDDIKLYVYFFKNLSESKFMNFRSKFFPDQFIDVNVIYKNLGVDMFEYIGQDCAETFNIILVEDIDYEFYSKKCDSYFYVVANFDAYNLSPENRFRIQSILKKYYKPKKLKEDIKVFVEYEKFYELYLKICGKFYKIGFVYPVKKSRFVKHFIILFLPKEILKEHTEFLKKLVFSFQNVIVGEIIDADFRYVTKDEISEIFKNAITSPHHFTIGADFEYEMVIDGNKVSARDILLNTVYEKTISPKLSKNKVGVDGNSTIGEFRTTPTTVGQLDKLFKDVKSLISKTKKKVKEKYDNLEFNFTGKSSPLGFHIHFGIPKELTTHSFSYYPYQIKEYFKKSVAHLLDLIIYRHLYVLNSFARWTSDYSSFSKREKTEIKAYGVEYKLFPSSILLEDFYKTVISFSVELVQRYFTKDGIIEIPLNEHYEIDESFYPVEFFEKLKKIKDAVRANDSERKYYQLIVKKLTNLKGKNLISPTFVNYLNSIEEMVNLLNDKYLTDSFVYYSCYDSNDNPLQIYYSSKTYYDLVNRKQVIIYGLFFSEKMVLELIGGNSEEFNETFLKMLKEAEENGQLKENHEKVYSELSEKFEFLKSKQMVAVN